MASGAKRRKAAKKKKEKAAISNGNGEVKVMESGSGGNSSPASQDLEPRQNPFGEVEDKDLSLDDESMESGKCERENGEIVQNSVEAESDNGEKSYFDSSSLKVSTNGMLENYRVEDNDDDNTQFAEKNNAELELQMPANKQYKSESFADHVMDSVTHVAQVVESNVVVQEKVIHDSGSIPVEILAGSVANKLHSVTNDKVHPSETFLEFKETSSCSPGPSEDNVGKQFPQSNVLIPDVQKSADKEPLLLVQRPVPKTSWIGCCGLFELFTGTT